MLVGDVVFKVLPLGSMRTVGSRNLPAVRLVSVRLPHGPPGARATHRARYSAAASASSIARSSVTTRSERIEPSAVANESKACCQRPVRTIPNPLALAFLLIDVDEVSSRDTS